MYKHILIPTDGSEVAAKAVEKGIAFAREAGARVTLFTAVPEYQLPSTSSMMAHQPVVSLAEHERRSRDKAGEILGSAIDQARAAGVDWDSDYLLSDHPYRAIIDAAKRHGCDAIVMASHGRTGLAKLWYGSETEEVLTHSDIPTLVYR
jgi:nucleotide-binding universal stress UspA family protein